MISVTANPLSTDLLQIGFMNSLRTVYHSWNPGRYWFPKRTGTHETVPDPLFATHPSRLHVARAGTRPRTRFAHRSVQLRHNSIRNGYRAAGLQRQHYGTYLRRHSAQRTHFAGATQH